MNRRDWTAVTIAALLALLFWSPLLRLGHIYPSGDLNNLFWPQRVHLARSVAAGVVPLWNPWAWGGAPFLASMQPGVFDVTSWFALVTAWDPIALLGGFNAQRLLLFLILSANTFALARRGLGVGRLAAVLAAVTVSCAGFLWGRFDHVNVISAMVWFPLVLLGALRAVGGATRAAVALITVAVALQIFAGHPQHVALGLLAVAVTVTVWLLGARSSPRVWLRVLGTVALGYALAGVLASVQLLPALELARFSERALDPVSYAASYSMRWEHLWRLIHPGAFGEFPHYITDDNFSELGMFIGRVPLALALLALALAVTRTRSPRRTAVWSFAALGVFSVLWALGSNGPIFEPLVRLIPPLRSFRVPPRMLTHLDLSLALLAALGLDAALRHLRGRGWRPEALRLGAALLIALTLLDLWMASRSEYCRQPCPADTARTLSPAIAPITSRDSQARLFRLQIDDTDYFIDPRPLALTKRLLRLQPNMGMRWGIGDIEGYTEGLLPTARWRDLMRHLHRNLHRRFLDTETLALLGVRWVLTDVARTPIEGDALRPTLHFTDQEEERQRTYVLFENTRALPLVLPRATLESLAAPENFDGLWSRGLSPDPVVNLEGLEITRPNAAWPERSALPRFPARWENANTLTVENPDGFAGEVALIQATYPGWVAVDDRGERQPLTPLNAVWSSWHISRDTDAVALRFEPASQRLGLFMSLAGMMFLMVAVARRGGGTARGHTSPARARSAQCDTDTR